MILEIIPIQGQPYRIEVDQVRFVNKCPHCDVEFCTTDHRRQYPDKSHQRMMTRYRQYIREASR